MNSTNHYGHDTSVKTMENSRQYLSFRINNETYGLEIHRVKEILEFRGCTRMPMVPEYIRGVINLRGHVVPVMDIQRFFFDRESEITRWSCIVIVEGEEGGENQFTGILVDSVRQVMEIPEENLDSPPEFGTSVSPRFIEHVGRLEEELIIILSLDALLSSADVGEEQKTSVAAGS